MPQRVLALEIDAQELKAALVETTFRDYRVVGFYRAAVAVDDGDMAEQVRRFLETNRLEPTTVLSSLPGDLVSWRTLFLPFSERKRLDKTVPFELETHVPFGLDEIVVDYHVLHRDKSGSTFLAALVQRRDLEEHLALLSAAGLDPKVVDMAPLAALNVLQLLGSEQPDTFAYIGIGPRRLLVALYRNRRLVGLRTVVPAVPVPSAEVENLAAGNGQAAAPPALAAVVKEIRWTLMALNGAPLEPGVTCIIAGEGAQFDEVGEDVAASMNLTVRRLSEAPLRNMPAALRRELPGFVAPLGLALREVAPNEALGVNFRQGEFAYHRGQDEMRRALWRTGALAAVALGLMIVDVYVGYQQLAARLNLVQAQISQVFSQTLPDVRRAGDERAYLQAEIDAEQKKLQVLGGVAPLGGTTAIDALRAISTAISPDLKIDIDEYIMDPETVRVRAKTDSFEAVDAIKQHVASTQYFADVQVKDVKAAPGGQGVDFRIIFSFNKDGTNVPARP